MKQTFKAAALGAILAMIGLGCSDPTTDDGGSGTVEFVTWGEDYIENEIPASPPAEEGIFDGWTVRYSKFLAVVREITIADPDGQVVAEQDGSVLVDLHAAGVKPLVAFEDVPAKNWESVSYVIAPADDETEASKEVADEDLEAMREGGLSVHVVADVTKGDATVHIDWSFTTATLYKECKAELDGKETYGVVVTQGGTDVVEVTIHGDHLFYDDLEASTAQRRFDAIACADADGDGDVTLDELDQTSLLPDLASEDSACSDRPVYKPGSQTVNDLGHFVRALSRTVGHYRGEGECVSEKQ